MMDALAVIVERLNAAGLRPKKAGRGWRAFCPVHENPPAKHKPSLYVGPGKNGSPVLTCKGGCETEKVLASLGMTFRDFHPEPSRQTGKKDKPSQGKARTPAPSDSAPVRALETPEEEATLWKGAKAGAGEAVSSPSSSSSSSSSAAVVPDWAALAKQFSAQVRDGTLRKLARDFGVSMDSLRKLGIGYDKGKDAFTFPMADAAGRIVGLRYRPRKNPHQKYAAEGGQLGLFIPEDVTAGAAEIVNESESDCAAAITLGFGAVALPGAGQCLDALVAFLRQSPVACPCIVGDADEAGRRGAERAADALLAAGIPCRVLIPPEPHKDLRAWLQAGLTAGELRKAVFAEPVRYPDRAAGWIPGYSRPSNNFIRRALPLLGAGPFALAVLLASFDAGNGKVFPDRDTLAKTMDVSAATVDRWKRELAKAGVLRWLRGRKGRCNEYTINFGPCKEFKKRRSNT